jgi:hypothetical protein
VIGGVTVAFVLHGEHKTRWYLMSKPIRLTANYTASHGRVLWYIRLKLQNRVEETAAFWNAMQSSSNISEHVLPPSSGWNNEGRSIKFPEDSKVNNTHCENLKSCVTEAVCP